MLHTTPLKYFICDKKGNVVKRGQEKPIKEQINEMFDNSIRVYRRAAKRERARS